VWGCPKGKGERERERCCPHPSSIIEDFGGGGGWSFVIIILFACLFVLPTQYINFFFKKIFRKGKKS
jgi:hypothetical protein